MTHASRSLTLAGLVGALLAGLHAPVSAQTPAAYESTPQGRVLVCFGEAYTLVELIDVATQNLALLGLEVRRAPEDARPALAAGLAFAGTQIEQGQAMDVANRLVECTETVSTRAPQDAAAAFAARAVLEEIDVAISMAEGFESDYQSLQARLQAFFSGATDPSARQAPTRPFERFGREMATALRRSRTATETLIAASTPKPPAEAGTQTR